MTIKTDWLPGERFTKDDYNRIKSNIAEVYVFALTLFSNFQIVNIPTKDYSDFYFKDVLNSIEQNLDTIAENTYRFAEFEPTRRFNGNSPMWTQDDINRIEKMVLYFVDMFSSIESRMLKMGTFATGNDRTRQVIRTVNS